MFEGLSEAQKADEQNRFEQNRFQRGLRLPNYCFTIKDVSCIYHCDSHADNGDHIYGGVNYIACIDGKLQVLYASVHYRFGSCSVHFLAQ